MQHMFWCDNAEESMDLLWVTCVENMLKQCNYIFFQLKNLFTFLWKIFLLSDILLHLDEEPLFVHWQTEKSYNKF